MAGPGNSTSWLNSVSLSEFIDLVEKDFSIFGKMVESVAQQLFIFDNLEAHTGETKRYDEADTETYASNKPQGSDAVKASAGVGLKSVIAQLKSLLINGKSLQLAF